MNRNAFSGPCHIASQPVWVVPAACYGLRTVPNETVEDADKNGSSAVRGASPAAAPPTSPHLSNQRPPTSTGTLKLPPLSPGEGWPHQPPRAAALAPSCPSCPSQTSVGRSANPWTQRWRSPPPSARLGGRLCSVSPSARPVRCCALLCSAVLPAAAGARCRTPGPPTAPEPKFPSIESRLPPPPSKTPSIRPQGSPAFERR